MSANLRGDLDRLSALEDGWLDGDGGKSITPAAMARGREALNVISTSNNPATSVFPTEEGGVSFFWSRSEDMLTVDITPDGTMSMHRVSAPSMYQSEALANDDALRMLLS